jgi:alkanesulfonate monooxygenase SsuD/methylene tetrahydromethanopterin reductase-like flavin-dependent oxidoreductase (luciferase family)
LTGEPVTVDGRRIQITPACTSPGGPAVMLAGGSAAAVKRAARHGLGVVLQTNQGNLKELYENECRAHGHAAAFVALPAENAPTVVFVADDVDKAWEELGPHLLHDAVTAAAYRPDDDGVASISRAADVSELRDADGPYRVFTLDEAADYMRGGRVLPLAPLCGGVPPDLAWPYLKRAAEAAARVS